MLLILLSAIVMIPGNTKLPYMIQYFSDKPSIDYQVVIRDRSLFMHQVGTEEKR